MDPVTVGGVLSTIKGFATKHLASVLKIGDKHDEIMAKDPDGWIFGYYHWRAAMAYERLKAARASGGSTDEILKELGIDIPEDDHLIEEK